jgi:hypothetical protein
VGDGFHCHPGTVRKAWLAGGDPTLEARAKRAWKLRKSAPVSPVLPAVPVRKAIKKQALIDHKARISRDFQRK